ncbi:MULTISPECIES: HU family DNA-binding protein [Nitrosomonas]|jgi:DNA-binding protein HU-beta|uniref:DNA-binding protein HU-beta n=1 Tax=Nitrosomonas oligotropha TaxID=42354 RepID=A0A1H8VL03_9PROT|nr:HU family DNA-binding protein [Nitrosomonas oligotropha]SDX62189.1 DNA-binding protein HU-beta [Nitrosomonas oligotropha]SEP16023.1 DNA-binding protein HU-beta [Nitrosomonas oligotropha]
MNKTEMIEEIASRTNLTKADAARAVNAVLDTIVETVAKGDDVTLPGFGSFKSVQRAAREGKNPKTGEKLQIAATIAPKFSAGATFKSAVAKK